MKVAIPTEQGKLSHHFGHCPQMTFVTLDQQQIVDQQVLETPPHQPGVLPTWLRDQGAQVVLAGGIGDHAIALLSRFGIQTVVGVPEATPAELASAYAEGNLVSDLNRCDHGPDHHCHSEEK